MKNSENDNLLLFDDLPTAEEADFMEAAANDADCGEFNEQAVAGLAIARMKDMTGSGLTETLPETATAEITAMTGAESPANAHPASRRSGRRRRTVMRVMLIAACVAVLLLGTFVAAAKVIYDVRFTQLIGVEGTMTALENGYVQIGLSKTVDDLTVTVVDAIGDSRTQWVEIRTNRPLEPGTPDGWLEPILTESGRFIRLNGLSEDQAATDFLINFFNGSWLATVFSDIDCTEYYRKHLVNESIGMEYSASLKPFCRDGYLWYMLEIDTTKAINRSFAHLILGFHTAETDNAQFEFNWCNNYKAKETTYRVDKSVGDARITKVVLCGASLFLYSNSGYDDYRLDSVTLANGTVLHTINDAPEIPQEKQSVSGSPSAWYDGRRGCSGHNTGTGFFTDSVVQYSLLPGLSFRTPDSMTTLIPADEIVAVTINGVEISLR